MLDSFGIDIAYDYAREGFYLVKSKHDYVPTLIKILQLSNIMSLIAGKDYTENKNTLKHISFDDNIHFRGYHHILTILQAIKERHYIQFNYSKFNNDDITTRVGQPYMLKEYTGRWYIAGLFDTTEPTTSNQTQQDTTELNLKERIFGLDRIENLQTLPHKYTRDPQLKFKHKFEPVIGINYSQNTQQSVILSFTPTQGKYIKTLPWHYTQKILIDNDDELRIQLNVAPNYELTEKILQHIQSTVVIEPQWLRDDIADILSRSLGQHQ